MISLHHEGSTAPPIGAAVCGLARRFWGAQDFVKDRTSLIKDASSFIKDIIRIDQQVGDIVDMRLMDLMFREERG